ncbi:MAG: hypothetical protein MPW15_26705 [Candidatus Manganitrophus sp.]|nr:hypothetical protein [Candidatus Manganitrophus sp.]
MKKWIGFFAAFMLAMSTAPAFANHIEPIPPKGIADKEVKKHFERGIKAFKQDEFHEAAIEFEAAEKRESHDSRDPCQPGNGPGGGRRNRPCGRTF